MNRQSKSLGFSNCLQYPMIFEVVRVFSGDEKVVLGNVMREMYGGM